MGGWQLSLGIGMQGNAVHGLPALHADKGVRETGSFCPRHSLAPACTARTHARILPRSLIPGAQCVQRASPQRAWALHISLTAQIIPGRLSELENASFKQAVKGRDFQNNSPKSQETHLILG